MWLNRKEAQWQELRKMCRAKYAAGSQGFLHTWFEMPDEQYNLLEGQNDSNSVNKSIEEIREEQRGRFIADLDKLDSLDQHLYPVARILYGDDWKKRLLEYNHQQEVEKKLFAGSVICTCFGGTLVLSSLGGIIIQRLNKPKSKSVSFNQPSHSEAEYTKEKTDECVKQEEPGKQALSKILNCHQYDNKNKSVTEADEEQTGGEKNASEKNDKTDSLTKHLYTDYESVETDVNNHKSHVKLSALLGLCRQWPRAMP